MDQASARRRAVAAVDRFTKVVEGEALRRIAEQKGATQVSRTTVRPTIDNLNFLSARREDLDAMRREIQPLARRPATRLTQEHHANRGRPLDFSRPLRAPTPPGGVPIPTPHNPKH